MNFTKRCKVDLTYWHFWFAQCVVEFDWLLVKEFLHAIARLNL